MASQVIRMAAGWPRDRGADLCNSISQQNPAISLTQCIISSRIAYSRRAGCRLAEYLAAAGSACWNMPTPTSILGAVPPIIVAQSILNSRSSGSFGACEIRLLCSSEARGSSAIAETVLATIHAGASVVFATARCACSATKECVQMHSMPPSTSH